MAVAEWISLVVMALKFFLVLMDKMSKTPSEKRRQALAELDIAMAKADDKKDLSNLSKWLGSKT